jgi:hypothetical protein
MRLKAEKAPQRTRSTRVIGNDLKKLARGKLAEAEIVNDAKVRTYCSLKGWFANKVSAKP